MVVVNNKRRISLAEGTVQGRIAVGCWGREVERKGIGGKEEVEIVTGLV